MNLTSGINLYVLYKIIRGLVTPFKETKAYELGLIDEDGNILKSRSELETTEEKNAFTLLDLFIFNIKKLLEKIPGGSSKFVTFSTALFLLKENYLDNLNYVNYKMIEEEIANIVGNGTNVGLDKPVKNISNKIERRKFGTTDVFVVDSDIYYNLLKEKPKFARYSKYLGDKEEYSEIKEFALKNPSKPIILQNNTSGFMKYLRF